jgi:hypothetical protein
MQLEYLKVMVVHARNNSLKSFVLHITRLSANSARIAPIQLNREANELHLCPS